MNEIEKLQRMIQIRNLLDRFTVEDLLLGKVRITVDELFQEIKEILEGE